VTYDWNVGTTQQWMNVLAPILKPLFSWNHNVIRAWGGEGLSREARQLAGRTHAYHAS
jgi:hypothetical protein